MPERLVIIGADAAGMSAASQARRRRGPQDLEIVAFDKGNYSSYSACGIPYLVGNVVDDIDSLVVRRPEEFKEKQDIAVHLRHEVTEIDLGARRLTVRSDGGEHSEGFDHLLYAAGGKPKWPPLEGADSKGIFGVQTLDDGAAIERYVEDDGPRRAVVVGAGYIGLEMAEAFVNRGLEVTLVERDQEPMSKLDPDMGKLVHEELEKLGVDVRTNESVTHFESGGGRVTGVVTESGSLPADIVALGLGTGPNADLAEAAGIPLGESGGVAVDERMRTRVEGVWSAGDCAEKFHRVSRRPVSIALGTHANKEGRVAGINLGGGDATFPGVVGTAVSKVCGLEVAVSGLKEEVARSAGFDIDSVVVESTTRAGYFPGAKSMKTKLIFEKGSGRLLGGQILGEEGAAKRIDVIATALWNEMTVGEMMNMDLGYAPPFSPVWDPVLIAARKAAETL